jgi:K+-sensing histidine kinase KdpD
MSDWFTVAGFVWLVIGCVVGFGGGILYVFLLAASPESQPRPIKTRLPLIRALVRGSWTTAALLAAAGICYAINFDKTLSILVLIAAVLLVSKLAGPVYGLTASVAAAAFVAYFLPPPDSFRVANPEDQLALALFLVTAIIGTWLVRERNGVQG